MEKQLIITLILSLSVVVGNAMAPEGIDSLSYAYGHQYTLATMAGKNELMQSDEDFRDYIRGLEDVGRNRIQMNDSSYMVSYILGAMEAVFMTDGMHHKRKEDLPPFSCIIAGLRKVGDGNVSMPSDTIAAMDLINRYSKGGNRPVDLDEEEKCSFFTAYGIMKAYQPGLREYAEELKHGTSYKENRQAYATGMADILEAYAEAPKSAYDMGRMVSLSMTLTTIGIMNTESVFAAYVDTASVDIDTASYIVNVQWDFNADDAIKWAKFTEACIGRHVAVEIDGRFMFAPRVNQQITGGRCAVAGLTSDEINLLFGDAEKGGGQESVDTIEIIEMD